MYDSDPKRRDQIIKRVPSSFSKLAHLALHYASFGNFIIWWETSPSTPVSHAVEVNGPMKRMAFVAGDYDASYTCKSDAAVRLLKKTSLQDDGYAEISGKNGYYFAAVAEECGRLVLGTDVLGYFPLCYWAKGDVFLFGTSPELFNIHPLFEIEPDPQAVISILLLSYISGGQTIYKGVRRSSPGYLLDWRPGSQPREVSANPLVLSDAGFSRPYADIREEVSAIFDSFVKPLQTCSGVDFFLSGGQDSRLIAGYAGKHLSQSSVQAVSVGRSYDMELKFARNVSKELGWAHRFRDIEDHLFSEFARFQLQLESFQGPFVDFSNATSMSLLAENDSPFLSGFAGDGIIGDKFMMDAFSGKTGLFCFDTMFEKMNRYGFSQSEVVRLVAPIGSAADVQDVIDRLRQEWDGIQGYPFQRGWLNYLTYRNRLHVGSNVWRLSLGSWPLLPYIDRRLLDLTAGMPKYFFNDRRIQKDILIRDFPRLAQLPLDRNFWEPGYLVKPKKRLVFEGLRSMIKISWRLGTVFDRLERRGKARYYYRVFDFNAPGWQRVRLQVDSDRPHCVGLLAPKVVDRLLPPAGTSAPFKDGIIDSWKTKTLAGLVLWYGLIKKND
jgi:asparagine synthase (glutamine-hydrolysing)